MLRHLILLLISFNTVAQSALNTTLLDHWQDDNLITNSSLVRYNECEGFVWNGQEYGIVGSTEGTHFFKLGKDDKLDQVDFVRGDFSSTFVIHRDFAVYKNYVYSVCDEGESSLQIIDISYLPDSVHLVTSFPNEFARVHNIFIDTTSALLYSCTIAKKVGSSVLLPTSMEVHSLADPLNPQLMYAGPSDINEVHDAFVKNNIAFLNCGVDGLRVYDFTNPTAPAFLQNLQFYQDQGYNHQGWLSPDGKTYVFGDETKGKRLKKCSVTNNQVQITSLFGTNFVNESVPHNIYLTNEFAYVAYYNEGLRIYDIRGDGAIEVAHYDTYPKEQELFKMRGAWGVHKLPLSSRILVSDRINGAFLIDFNEEVFLSNSDRPILIFPNPSETGDMISIKLANESIKAFSLNVIDPSGRMIYEADVVNQNYVELRNLHLASGAYTVRVQYPDQLGDQVIVFDRFVVY